MFFSREKQWSVMVINKEIGDKSIGIVLNSVRRLIRSYRLFSREVEKEYGITGAQLFVLQALDQGAPGQALTINELAERSFTHQSTVSEVVARLKAKKFVIQRKSEEDLRKTFLSLSSTGKSLLKRAPKSPGSKLVEGLLELSPKERAQLAKLLSRMLHTAGLDHEPAELFFQEK
jgi:DNA-binding MarR family transcriptional regulator